MNTPNDPSATRDDAALLADFVATRSETAFRALVDKYLGMLLGVARRQTATESMAEEVVQTVFAVLARKASRVRATPTLAGWLHRATMVECAATMRKERARREKMKHMFELADHESAGESVWREAMPVLDEALNELPPADRNLLLLRFWEKQSFREIAGATGKSEAASQKQSERALAKLTRILNRRGIGLSASVLAAGLPAQWAGAAPAALAAGITQGALAAAPALSATTLIIQTLEAMTYAKTKTALAVALAVALVAAVPLGIQWNENQTLRTRMAELEQRIDTAAAATPAQSVTAAGDTLVPTSEHADNARSNTPANTGEPAPAFDPVDEWQRALAERDPVRRTLWLSRLIDTLNADNAPLVAQVFQGLRESGRRFDKEHELFLRAWGTLDGTAAVAHAMETTGATSTPALHAAVAGWAGGNPAAAKAWVETLDAGQDKENLIVGLLDGWTLTDHEGASRYAESRPRTPARNRMRQLLLDRVLASGGVPAAQTWFEGVDGEGANRMYKQLAFDELVQKMISGNADQAAEWIAAQDGEPWLGGRAIRKVAGSLARQSPETAIEFIGSMENLKQGQVVGSHSDIIATWAGNDPTAAGNWLSENGEHPAYDAMANRYILSIADQDPATAIAWANSIENETRRQNSRLVAAAAMLAGEGDAAVAKLRGLGFTDEEIRMAPEQRVWASANAGLERVQLTPFPRVTDESVNSSDAPATAEKRVP